MGDFAQGLNTGGSNHGPEVCTTTCVCLFAFDCFKYSLEFEERNEIPTLNDPVETAD
jgi:hypothetical protein